MIGDPDLSVMVGHREFPSGVPAALESLGVSTRRTTLRAGDYVVGNRTRIERKTVRDLHESVASGRFWMQLNQLRAACAFPVVVVEGRDLDAGRLSPNGIRGVLVALGDRGLAVLRTTDSEDSARWIRSLALSRPNGKRIQIRAPYRRPIGRREPTSVAMLSSIPTISLPNARALVDSFGTVRRIADANVDELRAVRGIGRRRSETLLEAFNRRF